MSRRPWFVAWMVLLLASVADARRPTDDEEQPAAELTPSAPFRMPAKPKMGATTPDGAQDIDFARDRIQAGEVPHANTFTPEGLFRS